MISFSITDWLYWGDIFCCQSNIEPIAKRQPDLSNIPAIQRRRLPLVARRINQFVLTAKKENIPTVYFPQQGEISQTLAIIRSYENEVSPAKFSLSVHNAIAGILSVIHQNKQSYQVIDSLSGGIEMAIVEAVSLLSQHKRVNVVYYDEALPQDFRVFYQDGHSGELPSTMVLGLTICQGNDLTLTKQKTTPANKYQLSTDFSAVQQVADFIRHAEGRILNNHYASCYWQWKRNGNQEKT
ncbi:MAG: hypothetical protein CSA44_01770 [Gammaproteobacteria bacterium]|nr:MAG: hypothetical protein CSA44_01770 [Gammaproteobacteria bacterium]